MYVLWSNGEKEIEGLRSENKRNEWKIKKRKEKRRRNKMKGEQKKRKNQIYDTEVKSRLQYIQK